MKWFRKHLKHGSRLALFALAIQFALSFGHFHTFANAAPAIATGLTQVDLDYARSLSTQHTAGKAEQKQRPATPDTDHSADTCAICAVISLAGNVLLSTPPLLQLPQAVELLHLTTDAEFVHLNSVHPAFHSRAPPAS
jgi:hypothetical protein